MLINDPATYAAVETAFDSYEPALPSTAPPSLKHRSTPMGSVLPSLFAYSPSSAFSR
jgi:hypothetical protein